MILQKIQTSTTKYVNKIGKNNRKKIGQFFTPIEIARYMAQLSVLNRREVRILDPGSGSGILTSALLQEYCKYKNTDKIEVDLYENDLNITPLLSENMKLIKQQHNNVNVKIIKDNFILKNSKKWKKKHLNTYNKYDIVIANPPYKKIGKNTNEVKVMQDIVYGQPNIYFLFMAMSVNLLNDNGELIFIVPRSWTSGLYFKKFRKYFFENMVIEKIHLFVSRDDVFSNDKILQEIMIIKAKKNKNKPKNISISTSIDSASLDNSISFTVPYNVCVNSQLDNFVFLPTSSGDINVLKKIGSYKNTLEYIGFKVKTGLTVDFREIEYIQNQETKKSVPLFSAMHCNSENVKFPLKDIENQYISANAKSLLMENTNYLFMKRFSSKEERRRLQISMFLSAKFKKFPFISTENHINFITCINRKMKERELYGLYVIFNSTLWDKYYRILNGSTQVNATEINCTPVPSLDIINKIGQEAKKKKRLTVDICDNLIKELNV